jgi:hypothetical protein
MILIVLISLSLSIVMYKPGGDTSSDETNKDDDTLIDDVDTPMFHVEIDKYNKTITIVSIEKGTDLFWSNVEVKNGTATLPAGRIEVGDVITDCIGLLDFIWTPTNTIFLQCEFVRSE